MSSTAADDPDYIFPFGVRLGIVFIVEAASLSILAVTSLLLYIAYSAITLKRGAARHWTTSTHIHFYFINLLISDLIQAIGGILDIQWIIDAKVTEGRLCTVQGIFKQMGDVGVALTSMTIALHTFSVLVFRWQSRPQTALIVLAFIWIFIALIIGISMATHKGQDYYGDTTYWCWITEDYSRERIGLEYLWLWLAAFVNLICYVFIALVVKGVIVIERNRVRFQNGNGRRTLDSFGASMGSERMKANAVAMQMLFYPAVYIITVFPIAVVRWMAFSGKSVPFPATAFASILFSSSGVLNVMLFGFTRPKLLPSRNDTNTHAPQYPATSFATKNSIYTSRNSIRLQIQDTNPLPDDYEIDGWKYSPRRASPKEPPTVHIDNNSPNGSRRSSSSVHFSEPP